MSSMHKQQVFGVEGYTLRGTIEFDKPRNVKMWPGKRLSLLDDTLKMRRNTTDAFYNVEGNLAAKSKKSPLAKSPRSLISDDIIKWNKRNIVPGPGAHKIIEKYSKKRILGAFNFTSKREDTCFLGDAMVKGHESPKYYSKNFELTEDKIIVPTFKTPKDSH